MSSLAEKFNIPPALFETIRKMNAEETEYQMKVKALMKKKGITSLGQLSPEEKKDFFNQLDAMHKAKHEEVELDEAIPKSTHYATVHSSSRKIVAKGNKKEMLKKMKELNAKEKGSHHLGMTIKGKVGDTFGEEVEQIDEVKVGDKVSFNHALSSAPGRSVKKTGTVHQIDGDNVQVKVKDKYGAITHKKKTSELTKEEVEKKTQPPFTPDKPKKNPGVIPGKGGTGPSRAAHLAKMALRKQLKKEDIDLDEAKKPVSKDDVTKLLIKYGNNPQSAKKMVDKEFASAVKRHPEATASKIAEVIRSVAEEVEELDELSKKTLSSYIDKADDSVRKLARTTLVGANPKQKESIRAKIDKKIDKRLDAMTNAVKKMVNKNEEVDLEEAKSSTGYDLYHKDFSSAMAHAYDFAKKKYNIEIDPLEIDRNVAMGPRKPASGKANAYRLLDKTGKKAIQVQVANLDNKRYELNMYKEDVQIDEVAASKALQKAHDDERKKRGLPDPSYYLKLAAQKKKEIEDMKKETQKEESGASKKKEDEFHTKLDKLVHKTFGHSSDEKKMKKEGVELTESHFKVGQRVECIKSGMSGTVTKVDPEGEGKYYTVKQDSGKVMKYAPDELKALKESVEESFSPAQIERMRQEYSKIKGIDPASDNYKKLITMLDKLDTKTLQTLAGAKIKFVSGLAQNRIVRKMNEVRNPQTSMKRAALSMDRAKEVVRHQKEIGSIRKKREALRNSFEPEESIEEKALWPGTPEYQKKFPKESKPGQRYKKQDYGYRGKSGAEDDGEQEAPAKVKPKKRSVVREALDRLKKKKEATAKESKKDFKSGDKLSGKTEPIEINPELKEQKT